VDKAETYVLDLRKPGCEVGEAKITVDGSHSCSRDDVALTIPTPLPSIRSDAAAFVTEL
jgi:hypothetical protein